jgi:DNA-binding transcriptional regulator YbjK
MAEAESNYQGRKTSRKGSAERRIKLLEAALRIISREGTRGIRHRAVASEADVPLAATTYYFEHIDELINDAFILFAERMRAEDRLLGETCCAIISDFTQHGLGDAHTREALSRELASLLTEHIESRAARPATRHLESAFRNDAMHNDVLRQFIADNVIEVHNLIEKALAATGSSYSSTDASVIMATINHLEYLATLQAAKRFKPGFVYATMLRAIQLVLSPQPAPAGPPG